MSLEEQRRFPFRVRPRHLETVDSLTRRVLATNGEPAALVPRLLARFGMHHRSWEAALHWMNRSTQRPPHVRRSQHSDGSSCGQCDDLLITRAMCTLCSHGEPVEQVPHFNSPVCVRHHRWVGLLNQDRQHTVTTAHIDAARRFDTLRRKHQLDVRMYVLVARTLMREHDWTEAAAFPAVIATVRALTSVSLQRELLAPSLTFAQSYRLLRRAVTRTAGARSPELTRTLWLLLRPAFASVRSGETSQRHPHDLRIHAAALHLSAPSVTNEHFSRYLAVTGDTAATADDTLAPTHARIDMTTRRRTRVCAHGHNYSAASASSRCSVCPSTVNATPGTDDLATVAPKLLREWDVEKNLPLFPQMVTEKSRTKVHWRCRRGHAFAAKVNDRVTNDQGCPVCAGRVILPGVNDFATRYPAAFAEFRPFDGTPYEPHRDTPTSNKLVNWECVAGHTYRARFRERAQGYGCQQCRRLRSIKRRGSLASTRPDLAAEWVVTDDERTPHDYSALSRYEATWRCAEGHHHLARIEHRVHGATCPYCANRLLLAGFNDLAASHPELASEWHPYKNRERPDQVFADADTHRYWRCENRHETMQSAPDRLATGGCAQCAPNERATNRQWQAARAPLAASHPSVSPAQTATSIAPRGEASEERFDDETMDDLLRDALNDSSALGDLVTVWAELTGLTEQHASPACVLREVIDETAVFSVLGGPAACDLADTVLDMTSRAGDSTPPAHRLLRATQALLRVIYETRGPFDSEDDFRHTLLALTLTADNQRVPHW